MKPFLFLLLLATGIFGQEYYTGQGARLMIGQRNFTEQSPESTEAVLGSTSGIAYFNNTLYVIDSNRLGATPNNQRVLIFRDVSSFIYDVRGEIPQDPNQRCPACVGRAANVLGRTNFSPPPAAEVVQAPSQKTLRNPVGVAANAEWVAVADTDNNRVLLWRGAPATDGKPADLVLGQKDFTTSSVANPPTASSLRGPQGVWFDPSGGLWVADSGNNRILYYGRPSQNGAEARLVLGQKDFTSNPQGATAAVVDAKQDNMLTPVSVTTDGRRLYVADLGFSRVLIWNSIPTSNGQLPDVVVGQRDFTSQGANRSAELCPPSGTDSNNASIFPPMCARTLNFPRFALSDGRHLFISDSGNDRVLVYNTIPTVNAMAADAVLGQLSPNLSQASDSAEPLRVSASDSFRTPSSLAHDGQNLYIADIFNRRVLVYAIGDYPLPITAVRNSASPDVFAIGGVTVSGEPKENDEVSIKIAGKEYKYKVLKDEGTAAVARKLADLINANGGDPNVLATVNGVIVVLSARKPGPLGNEVTLEVTSAGTSTVLTASGATLTGGQDAARIAPFTLVTILGENLSDQTVSMDPREVLPTQLGGVQVYFDGILAPLQSVSPSQIVAQIPVQVEDSNSANIFVRTTRNDSRITASAPVGVPIIGQNPGVYAGPGDDPRPGVILHSSSQATGTVSVDGTAKGGDIATIIIGGRQYSYTVKDTDTLPEIMNGLIETINAGDPLVEAYRSGPFTRVRLRARIEGPEGNGIPIATKVSDGANVILTATNTQLCCANEAGALVTADNPAVPGETIVVLATGLGVVKPDEARAAMINGSPYSGPYYNEPLEFVSSLAGGKTANVLYAGIRQGAVGIYEVHLELNSDLPTNGQTQATIAQSFQVSNIFTFALVNPKQPE